jgi:hypothetical protein
MKPAKRKPELWVRQTAHWILQMLPAKRADRLKILQQVNVWVEEETPPPTRRAKAA